MKVTAEHLDTPSKSDTFTQLPTRSSSSSIEHDGRIHAATQTDQKDRIVLLIAFMPKKFLNPRQKYQDIPPAAKNFDRHLFPEAGTAVTEAVGRHSRISRARIPGEALYRQEEAVRLYFFTLSDKTFFFGQKTGIIMSCSSYLVPICTLAACGCTSQYMEIGNNWISTNERVVMIDTCSVDISSIRIDSVQTSGGNAVYAGCRESPYWGRTDISSYLTFKATEDYGEEISSTLTGNMSFMSGMGGIFIKIGFPYLNNLRSIWDHCRAASAELIVYPLEGSYCKQNYSSLPSTVNLYIMDENNISTGGAITASDGETLQSGSMTHMST